MGKLKKIKITKKNILDFLVLNLGIILVAVGVYFFKLPNNFTTGGVTALSMVLAGIIPGISAATFISILNIVFLILGFIFVNKSFGFRTIYGSIVFSLLIQLLEVLIPMDKPITDQKMLELVFAVLLPALGTALLYRLNASTGGTDILAMIIGKYFAVNVGNGLLISDIIIAFVAGLVFGWETCMYSVLGLFLKSIMIDWVIESLNKKKSMIIVTVHYELVRDYIVNVLKRSASVWDVHGAYTNKDEKMILTALSRFQARKLQLYLKENDPDAFTVVTNTSEIYGKGFLSIKS